MSSSFANAGGVGHHIYRKPFCLVFWVLPVLGGPVTIFGRSRLLRTEVEGKLLCNVLLTFCAQTSVVACEPLFPSPLLVCTPAWWVTQWLHLSSLSSFPPLSPVSCTSFSLSILIFINVPDLICSTDLSWVSPAQCLVSVGTALSFSVTLLSPLQLLLLFEYRSEMFFQKSKSLPAEQWVCSFFTVRSENLTSHIVQLMEMSLKFTSLRRGGRFCLVSFLLHLICFPQANHKGNFSLSLKPASSASLGLPPLGSSPLTIPRFAPVSPGDVPFPIWGQ